MIYYVEITGGKITGKGQKSVDVLNDNEVEVAEVIYNQLIRLPADFGTDGDGNIISVTNGPEPVPEPQAPTTEERLEAVELALLALMG